MKAFQYVTAQTPESAAEFASDDGRYIAGGIDVLGELKEYLVETKTLVNVKSLPGTHEIKVGADHITLGANVTLTTLAKHPAVQKALTGLAEAASEVGSPQIRNVASVGGNLAQHSRCWYYRHRDIQCLKKGGATCYAHDGENKYHALFTGNPCISPVVSNLGTMLAALEAKVVVLRDKKVVPMTIAELYHDAWENPLAHNSLKPADLILHVEIPTDSGRKSTYLQMSEKSDFDWALVSCGVSATVSGKLLKKPCIAVGAIAPVPYVSEQANAFLDGKELTDDLAAQAADLVLKDAKPLAHNGYKVPLAHTLIRRALLKLIA
jgi:xanthine dehydrogenase YagS FAD-binding subunit